MKGSVIKREGKDGAVSYLLKYDGPRDPVTNKRRQLYKTVRGTQKVAQAELRRLLKDIDDGTHVDPHGLTLAEWAETWLSDLEVFATVSLRTREGYGDWLRVHVLPVLGDVPLQKLTGAALTELYKALLKSGFRGSARKGAKARGLAPRTVLHVHRALSTCLKAAVKARKLMRNPADDAIVPKVKKTRQEASGNRETVKALSPDQLATLRAAFRGHELATLVEVAAATGLRRGELLGLRWSAIGMAERKLTVSQTVERTQTEGVVIKADAKNESSRRRIAIGQTLVDTLRAHRAAQEAQAGLLGLSLPADVLVFPRVFPPQKGRPSTSTTRARGVDFNRPWDPEAITKAFRRVAVAAGFTELKLHDMRHTHATLLLMAKVPVHEVAQRLGHSSPAVTMSTYSHVIERSSDNAANAWESIAQAV